MLITAEEEAAQELSDHPRQKKAESQLNLFLVFSLVNICNFYELIYKNRELLIWVPSDIFL